MRKGREHLQEAVHWYQATTVQEGIAPNIAIEERFSPGIDRAVGNRQNII